MSRFKRRPLQSTSLPAKTSPDPVVIKNNGNGNGNGRNGRLTFKQGRFVDEILKDPKGNATQAAIRAGYSVKGAGIQAFNLLKNIKVERAIAKRRKELMATTRIDQEWVLKRYEMLTEYCIDDFFNDDGTMKPLSEIPRDKLYAIGGFKQSKRTLTTKDKVHITNVIREFKLPRKKEVLDSIGRYLGMNEKDNQQKRPIVPVQINVTLAD